MAAIRKEDVKTIAVQKDTAKINNTNWCSKSQDPSSKGARFIRELINKFDCCYMIEATCKELGHKRCDFLLYTPTKKLVIEVDGYPSHFNDEKQKKSDRDKNIKLRNMNISVLRIDSRNEKLDLNKCELHIKHMLKDCNDDNTILRYIGRKYWDIGCGLYGGEFLDMNHDYQNQGCIII